jgi:hypothetical protein
MNWDALGAIGEVFGAGATLAMLVYLSIQIRASRETTQASTELEITKQLSHFSDKISLDPNLQRIWNLVATNSKEITDAEASHYLWHTVAFIITCEGVWFQYQRGMLSQSTWKSWERTLIGVLNMPLILNWWEKRLGSFKPEFYDFIDELLEQQSYWSMPNSEQHLKSWRENNSDKL